MHEFWVDFIDHGFSKILLKHSFVLLSQASQGMEDWFDRSCTSKFHDSVVFFIGGEDLKTITDNEQDIREKKFEAFGDFIG